MVVADPAAELLGLVRALGDPAPAEAPASSIRAANLLRRRFGMALPPPFAGTPGPAEPVRAAAAVDGAAIAAVKWRVFGTTYRHDGVLPETFLDGRDVVPPPRFWIGRAMVPPSRRHVLLVWGRPGAVFGYLDAGPAHHDPHVGEVYELYVDPSAQGRGGGGRLLGAAEDRLVALGFARLELSVLATNTAAQAFYRSRGWQPTGQVTPVDLGVVAFEEVRFARVGAATRP